jgi:sugar phosphate isomerase/epimerase
MSYTYFGQTDLRVSRLCQGTAFRDLPRAEDPRALRVLHYAIERGINFFDTAIAYGWGGAERVLGKAIAGRRDQLVICTKVPASLPPKQAGQAGTPTRYSRTYLREQLEESLHRLGTDYVDLYLLHYFDPHTPADEITASMQELSRKWRRHARRFAQPSGSSNRDGSHYLRCVRSPTRATPRLYRDGNLFAAHLSRSRGTAPLWGFHKGDSMKIGLYASMFGKDNPPTLESIESYIDHAYDLRLDLIDFRRDRGFDSKDPAYLFETKLNCLRKGLSVGYLASIGHFSGTDAELAEKVEAAKEDVDVALFLGASMIRIFTGTLADREDQKREVRCFQEIADYAATKGISVGLQNHPSTGDDIIRILEETDRENFSFMLDTGQWQDAPMYNGGGATPPDHDLYRYIEQTAKYTTHVRAKFFKIDSGKEEYLDYERIVPILVDAGYNGPLTVVFEGRDANACSDKEVIRLAAEQLRKLANKYA